MLVLTRRPGESLECSLSRAVDPSLTVGERFASGLLTLSVLAVRGDQVRVGIAAHRSISVLRSCSTKLACKAFLGLVCAWLAWRS